MMKPKLVKIPINEAASYTNFVLIESRAIYSRQLAISVRLIWLFGLSHATIPAVTVD